MIQDSLSFFQSKFIENEKRNPFHFKIGRFSFLVLQLLKIFVVNVKNELAFMLVSKKERKEKGVHF